jgi:hypothetical protein
MTRRVRWLFAAAILVLTAWAGYWGLATLALRESQTSCGSEVLQEATSPDRQQTATVFERGCGATSPVVRIVSLRPVGTAFDGDDTETWIFAIEGPIAIRPTWLASDRLTIKFGGGGGRVLRQQTMGSGVAISYE